LAWLPLNFSTTAWYNLKTLVAQSINFIAKLCDLGLSNNISQAHGRTHIDIQISKFNAARKMFISSTPTSTLATSFLHDFRVLMSISAHSIWFRKFFSDGFKNRHHLRLGDVHVLTTDNDFLCLYFSALWSSQQDHFPQ
jgi:hypothetical protein